MKRYQSNRFAWLVAVACAIQLAQAEVDFTPIESTRELDGIVFPITVFRDGVQKITYDPPRGWRLSGSGTKLTLVPQDIPNVDAQVEVNSLTAVLPINEANVQKYVASAQQTVPRGVKVVEVLGSTLNPLKICGFDTLAVEIQYEAFGTTYRSQLLYLNRDRQQWTFRFTAPAATYVRAIEPFRVSLCTFQGL